MRNRANDPACPASASRGRALARMDRPAAGDRQASGRHRYPRKDPVSLFMTKSRLKGPENGQDRQAVEDLALRFLGRRPIDDDDIARIDWRVGRLPPANACQVEGGRLTLASDLAENRDPARIAVFGHATGGGDRLDQ